MRFFIEASGVIGILARSQPHPPFSHAKGEFSWDLCFSFFFFFFGLESRTTAGNVEPGPGILLSLGKFMTNFKSVEVESVILIPSFGAEDKAVYAWKKESIIGVCAPIIESELNEVHYENHHLICISNAYLSLAFGCSFFMSPGNG